MTTREIDTWVWFKDRWHEGNVPVAGIRTHGLWLGSAVFDGARRFDGVTPDMDRHFARLLQSAVTMGLAPPVTHDELMQLAYDGLALFPPEADVYLHPMFWPEVGGYQGAVPLPESTQFALCLYLCPMPQPREIAITLSPYRRPTRADAPVDAKASCLYPTTSRALREAGERGFQNCVMLDHIGNVCELASSNIFCVKDGVVLTPIPNGCFLNGITRQRVISLLRGAGRTVVETVLRYDDLLAADEIFSTGNFAKVMPVARIDSTTLKTGPVFGLARRLYWDFAHATAKSASAPVPDAKPRRRELEHADGPRVAAG
jgi:branched-chain amino acid aminotransferase